jgi:hypothetical protein
MSIMCVLLCLPLLHADGLMCEYEATASGTFQPASYPPYKVFDSSYQHPSTWHSPLSYAPDGSFLSTATASTTVGSETVRGEWIQIKLPQAYTVKWYQVTPGGNSQAQMVSVSATKWRVVGSNDGNAW